jgi:hypothetical protein
MYTDPFDRDHQYPEAFTAHHDGDMSGRGSQIHLDMEAWRVKVVATAYSGNGRHGNDIVEVIIPFDVIEKLVAEEIRRKKISYLENATEREILDL